MFEVASLAIRGVLKVEDEDMKAICLLAATFCMSAEATSFGTDYSDLWWNSQANGEGFNVIQQGETLFVTFFVYDGANKPIWYVGSNVGYRPAANNFQGDLHLTQGPPGSSLRFSAVGTVTFSPTSATAAILTYTIDGAPFVKTLARQTWRNDDISGSYVGAKIGTYSGSSCNTNGYLEEPIRIVVTHAGEAVTMQTTYSSYSCTITGSYAQAGRMGSIVGNFNCSTGTSGSYGATEIEVTPQGITGRSTSTRANCSWAGHFGGVRRAP